MLLNEWILALLEQLLLIQPKVVVDWIRLFRSILSKRHELLKSSCFPFCLENSIFWKLGFQSFDAVFDDFFCSLNFIAHFFRTILSNYVYCFTFQLSKADSCRWYMLKPILIESSLGWSTTWSKEKIHRNIYVMPSKIASDCCFLLYWKVQDYTFWKWINTVVLLFGMKLYLQ